MKKEKYKIILVGDGEIKSQLLRQAHESNVNIIITGFVKNPIQWLARADLFVFSSLTEGLPGALIEAMAVHVPCIATDIPGNNELILNEKTGLLVNTRSPDQLAIAIERLIDDKNLCKQLSENAFKHVLDNYDYNIEKQLWLQLFNELESGNVN